MVPQTADTITPGFFLSCLAWEWYGQSTNLSLPISLRGKTGWVDYLVSPLVTNSFRVSSSRFCFRCLPWKKRQSLWGMTQTMNLTYKIKWANPAEWQEQKATTSTLWLIYSLAICTKFMPHMMDHTHPTMITKEIICRMADTMFKPKALTGLPSLVLHPHRQANDDMKVPRKRHRTWICLKLEVILKTDQLE